MKVIVDTCIWSEVLRRDSVSTSDITDELKELIKEVRVQMLGPIRQELLSGLKSSKQFDQLKHNLSSFFDLPQSTQDYEKASEFFNICRRKGIQGSNTDFLICALAYHHNYEIFTTDKDFEKFAEIIPIRLYQIRKYK